MDRFAHLLKPGPTCPHPPRGPQVRNPCGGRASLQFVQASAAANWFAQPARSTRLRPGQSCEAACAAAAASGRQGCTAYSISVQNGAAFCNLFEGSVPPRLCGAEDTRPATCRRGSQGSFRAKWVYA